MMNPEEEAEMDMDLKEREQMIHEIDEYNIARECQVCKKLCWIKISQNNPYEKYTCINCITS